jgi:hypothetical protein
MSPSEPRTVHSMLPVHQNQPAPFNIRMVLVPGTIIMSDNNTDADAYRLRPEEADERARSIDDPRNGAVQVHPQASDGTGPPDYRPQGYLAPQQHQHQQVLDIQQILENPAVQHLATTLAGTIAAAAQQLFVASNQSVNVGAASHQGSGSAALASGLRQQQPHQDPFRPPLQIQNNTAPTAAAIYASLPSLLRTLQDSSSPSSFSAHPLMGVAAPAPVPGYHQSQLQSHLMGNPSFLQIQQIQGLSARPEMQPPQAQAPQAQAAHQVRERDNGNNQDSQSLSITVPLFLDYDQQVLTQYQCLLRQQMELFEAGPLDVRINVKGRIKPLRLGQLGLRCRHCSMLPPDERTRGAVYFPGSVEGVYQIAQNMCKKHLCDRCDRIPSSIKHKLREMFRSKEDNNRRAGGKVYWVESLAVLGVYEDKETGLLRLRLKPR